jgi:hypothetical protein
MVNYQNGKIYKIVCNQTGKIYIGSTCKKLCQRIAFHWGDYKSYKKGQRNYITSFKILENGDYDIVLIENYPCDTKEELLKRERHYVDTLDCVNRNIPSRTNKEYYQDNKTFLLNKQNQYYQDNKETIKVKNKDYKNEHIDYYIEYNNKYREKNQELIKELKKQYYEENKNEILKKQCEKLECGCGGIYSKCHQSRHNKTKKHINYLTTLN